MPTCREVSRKLSEAGDRRLGVGERMGLWVHLKACGACSNFSRQMTLLHTAMQRYRDPRD
ncbi:MAG: hypothetical protein WCR74_19330 [Betaproteobacteria bacterium]